MYKKQRKTLKSLLDSNVYNDELFSKSSMNTIIRSLLEPVASQNTVSIMFTRLKNKEGLEGLIKRLEYCTNVEIVDVTSQGALIKDDYVELEFIIFTSARYNFALVFDYSKDKEKNYTKAFFLTNSRNVNDVYEILQSNMTTDYREKFYLHKPERRENELLNEALFNVFKKLNNSIEENNYKSTDSMIIDLTEENDLEDKIREVSHEIKNQLSIVDIYTKILEKENGKNKNVEVIKKASSIIKVQLNELKNYGSSEIKEMLLIDLIEEAKLMMEGVVKTNNNKIKLNAPKFDINVFVDESKLLSVFCNVIKNANESTENDEILINVTTEKNSVKIDIENHGTPIGKDSIKKVFDKGFTTKTKGAGIGLWACRKYVEDVKGELNLVESNKEKTVFEIVLPLH